METHTVFGITIAIVGMIVLATGFFTGIWGLVTDSGKLILLAFVTALAGTGIIVISYHIGGETIAQKTVRESTIQSITSKAHDSLVAQGFTVEQVSVDHYDGFIVGNPHETISVVVSLNDDCKYSQHVTVSEIISSDQLTLRFTNESGVSAKVTPKLLRIKCTM